MAMDLGDRIFILVFLPILILLLVGFCTWGVFVQPFTQEHTDGVGIAMMLLCGVIGIFCAPAVLTEYAKLAKEAYTF